MTVDPLVAAYPEVARIAAVLLRHPEVGARWHDESACAGMTVGGLAHHLAGETTHVVALLTAPAGVPGATEVLPVLEHYRRAAWVHSGADDEANVEIRASADAAARPGPEALLRQVADDLDALPAALEPVLRGERDGDAVRLPWQGWALSVHDLVLTRTMEVLVHSDDLAASIDVEPPVFPADAVHPVLALLAAVAAERHGQTALVRALSRPQRATGPVSAF